MMKTNIFKYYFVAILSFVSVMSASAQTVPAATNHDYVDTVAYKAPPVVDSTLVGVDIFHILHLKKSIAD